MQNTQFQPWMLIILTCNQPVLLSICNIQGAVLCLPRFWALQSVVLATGPSHLCALVPPPPRSSTALSKHAFAEGGIPGVTANASLKLSTRLDNLWSRLCCDSGTCEQHLPAGGIPEVTAIIGLRLSMG